MWSVRVCLIWVWVWVSQIEENFKIIDEAPIYDVFLKNMEQVRGP